MANMFDSDGEEEVTLTINEKFADKYEKRKQNEELTRLKEKYGNLDEKKLQSAVERKKQYSKDINDASIFDSDDESTSEEEDEYGELITPEVDAQIMKTILKVKAHDKDIYDSEKKFFSEQEMEKARQLWKEKQEKQKAEKPMHLKDYHRKVLLGEIKDDEEGEEKKEKTFVEEQNDLKKDFINEANNVDDDMDSFFTLKKKTKEEEAQEEEDYKTFLLENMADADNPNALQEWKTYKDNPNVDKNEAFLMDYILNRGWIEKDKKKNPFSLDTEEISDDEEEVDKADRFESQYNFRFEEEGGTQLITHSRNIEDSMRRKNNSRKQKRENVKQRKLEEKNRREEELKRLKNLKKQEIINKLKQIQEITGNKNVGFDDIDLDGDFNQEEYDKKMENIFNDEYYNDEDANIKPEFADDIDIDDIVPKEEYNNTNEEEGNDGYDENAEAYPEEQYNANANANDDDFIMDADYLPGGQYYNTNETGKKKKLSKKQLKKEKKLAKKKQKQLANQVPDADPNKSLNEYLDEYYQLDYEDMIGDTPTRFKYAKVKPENYGLSAIEILLADDKDLNEYISLKKLAPHRSEERQMKDEIKFNKSKKKRLSAFRKSLEEQMNQIYDEENQQQQEDNYGKKNKKKHDKKDESGEKNKKKRSRKKAKLDESSNDKKKSKKGKSGISSDRLASYGV
ncbi:Krr1-domain-containing protein [Piromyces finnis]|uniref:Krr1-domain-containing protein n=1 Tax=Piromyces finnis TaxID=1754191 RepID=A0A1Y1VMB5_9FUNG|nr:Krr1-domain-containing protein [Piromyces finnis]|eukprot:ORX59286.1 Krr1-domain-containing protein [Piromyces finnis]